MKLKIGTKLGLGFGIVLVLTVVIGLLSYVKVKDAQKLEEYLLGSRIPTIVAAKDLQNNLNYVASKTRQVLLAGDQGSRREGSLKLYAEAWENIDKDSSDLEKMSPGWKLQENRDRLTRIREQIPKYKQACDTVLGISNSRSTDALMRAGNEYSDRAIPINDEIKRALGDLVDSQFKLLNEEKEQIASANAGLFLTIAVTTVLALTV